MEHKLCPFCGGNPELVTEEMSEKIRPDSKYSPFLHTTIKYIRCTKCKARSGRYKIKEEYFGDDCCTTNYGKTDEDVWSLWDERYS